MGSRKRGDSSYFNRVGLYGVLLILPLVVIMSFVRGEVLPGVWAIFVFLVAIWMGFGTHWGKRTRHGR